MTEALSARGKEVRELSSNGLHPASNGSKPESAGNSAAREHRRAAGTGNPRAPLEERSRDELYNLAEEIDVRGRSRMNKNQLITAIRRVKGSEV